MWAFRWSGLEGREISSKYTLTIALRPVNKHASSSHNTRLVGGRVAPRGWWHITAQLLQCLQFPAWEQPLSPAWGRLRFPAWEHLPVPCFGTLQSLPGTLASSLPGNACQCACPAWACLQSLPGTLASSLPGNVCQCPAWARFAVPAWDDFSWDSWASCGYATLNCAILSKYELLRQVTGGPGRVLAASSRVLAARSQPVYFFFRSNLCRFRSKFAWAFPLSMSSPWTMIFFSETPNTDKKWNLIPNARLPR